ncbi:MAG TPA: hypothetical protein VGD66_03305 [Allosphingosinicella sp.]|jgi:hypothetical protein
MRRTFGTGSIVAAAAMLAMPAFAAPAPGDAGADTKQVCRRVESIGTHFAARTCHSRAEWREIEGADKDRANKIIQEADRTADRYPPPMTTDGPH